MEEQGSARKLQCTAGRLARALFLLLASPLGVWFAFSPGLISHASILRRLSYQSRLIGFLDLDSANSNGNGHGKRVPLGPFNRTRPLAYGVCPCFWNRLGTGVVQRAFAACLDTTSGGSLAPCAMSYCGSVTRRPFIRPPDVCPALASGVWRNGLRQHNSIWRRIRARTG